MIKTFVFLDCETTGLPSQKRNPKITELCLVCVQREHLLLGCIPRVLNKLNLCFNPQRPIDYVAAEITGLSNFDLEEQPALSSKCYNILINFIERLPGPVCLVAHNGHGFDFPIIQAELMLLNLKFPDTFLCGDSLLCFREILPKKTLKKATNDIWNDGLDEALLEVTLEVEKQSLRNVTIDESAVDMQQRNETTPEKQTEPAKACVLNKRPEKNQTKSLPAHVRINLFGDTNRNGHPKSHKLSDVYSYLTSQNPVDSHRAEADVMMLMESAIRTGETFIKWMDTHSMPFCDVTTNLP